MTREDLAFLQARMGEKISMGHKEAHKVMCGLMHAAMEGPDLATSGFLQNVGHLQAT